jgi:hypothetical protein
MSLVRKCIVILTLMFIEIGYFRMLFVYLIRGLVKGFFRWKLAEHTVLREIPGFICTVSIKSSKIHIFELYKVNYILCVVNYFY